MKPVRYILEAAAYCVLLLECGPGITAAIAVLFACQHIGQGKITA